MSEPLRVGIAVAVGAVKTTLVELLCRKLCPNFEVAVVTNDIYTQEDGEILCIMVIQIMIDGQHFGLLLEEQIYILE